MSRAFIKEPETAEPVCPPPVGCGGSGLPVGRDTLEAHAPPELAAGLVEPAWWCPNPACGVAWFDPWGGVILRAVARGLCWPKDPAGPVCSCFGIAAADLEEDGRLGNPERIRDLVRRAGGPEARCRTASPSGRPCLEEARRVYLRARPDV